MEKSIPKPTIISLIVDYLETVEGYFYTSDLYQTLNLQSPKDKAAARVAIHRLVKGGTLERYGKRDGVFRRPQRKIKKIDFLNASRETLELAILPDLKDPKSLHEYTYLLPGNIFLIAGAPNSGKTAVCFNMIYDNMKLYDIHYFNSEMGPSEMQDRLKQFPIKLEQWEFSAYERDHDFEDVIVPGAQKINIIDYLEIYDNFYEIGGKIARIWQKLNGAIAIIVIQKQPKRSTGIGGNITLEKPRLALAIDHGKMLVSKCKNFTNENPNYFECDFKLVHGYKFIQQSPWGKTDKWNL